MRRVGLDEIRTCAVGNAFFSARTVDDAVARLGFVQVDPIRAPAGAQDLILRQRVEGYRAGDLDAVYPTRTLEEDILYAYGVVTRSTWKLLHPRRCKPPTALERKVLACVRAEGVVHPRTVVARLGAMTVRNDWGGRSKATTEALHRLHRRGLVRVARRDKNTRLYAPAHAHGTLPPIERLRRLILLAARLLAPVLERSLRPLAIRLGKRLVGPRSGREVLRDLISGGALLPLQAEGETYLWPADLPVPKAPGDKVRLLAPFDPLVHDRDRFERLWGWPYRFEAYTPPAQRIRGYYALPLLAGAEVIGWANAAVTDRALQVEVGFAKEPTRRRRFDDELLKEAERLARFLDVELAHVSRA